MRSSDLAPAGRRPTLYNGDEMWFHFTHVGPTERVGRETLETIVDDLAKAKVSIFSQCFYGAGLSYYETRVGEKFYENYGLWGRSPDGGKFVEQSEAGHGAFPYRTMANYQRLVDEGNETIKVFADRSQHRGMKFLACLRMNDRHSCFTNHPCRFLREHPEFTMQPWGAMDYRHPEVQDYVAAHIEELATEYDIDGVELDWLRWVRMFSEDVPAEERKAVLNDFHRRVRAMLDAIGKRKGRRLMLAIRVPATLPECDDHGYDVATYCREKLVDIISPSDFLFNDPRLAIEDFGKLTRDAGILLTPSLHNSAGWSAGASSTETLRALAHSYYAQGADGISVFNWFTPGEINLPQNFQALEEVGDPQELDGLPRSYQFNPIWGEYEGKLRESQTGRVFPYFARVSRDNPGKRVVFPILIKEDFGKVDVKLRLKVEELTSEDEIAMEVNGRQLDLSKCATKFVAAGKRSDIRHSGPEWGSGAYWQFEVSDANSLLKDGENEIGLTLIKPNPMLTIPITLFEIWVDVEPRPHGV